MMGIQISAACMCVDNQQLGYLSKMMSSVTCRFDRYIPKGWYQFCRILMSVQFHALLHTAWKTWQSAQSQALISQFFKWLSVFPQNFGSARLNWLLLLMQLLFCRCGNSPWFEPPHQLHTNHVRTQPWVLICILSKLQGSWEWRGLCWLFNYLVLNTDLL